MDDHDPLSERQRKRPRSSPEPSSSASSEDDAECDELYAILLAETAAGRSVEQAVAAVFESVKVNGGPSRGRGNIDMAEPVLAALAASEGLRHDLRTVARLCQAILSIDTDELDGFNGLRPRLELCLSGFRDVAKLIADANNIVVLTGAGVSVSCGIPDFRSKGGLYDAVLERFGLEDPQAIFDLEEFKMDPTLFYSFAKDVMPSNDLRPSPTHRFIAELEARGKLLRNYSQNIDGLERRAGVSKERVILCHGSFLTATCMRPSCRVKIAGSEIASEVAAGKVPLCRKCVPAKRLSTSRKEDDSDDDDDLDACSMGVLKPDIVFFGENLPRRVRDNLETDALRADLVLVLGTSLQVSPVARIPQYFHDKVPRILVNRELVTYEFDVELLGNCDTVVAELRSALNWDRDALNRDDSAQSVAPKDLVKAAWERNPIRETLHGSAIKTEKPGDNAKDIHGHPTVQFRPPRRFIFQGASKYLQEEKSGIEPVSNIAKTKTRYDESVGVKQQSENELSKIEGTWQVDAGLKSDCSKAVMEGGTNIAVGAPLTVPPALTSDIVGKKAPRDDFLNGQKETSGALPVQAEALLNTGNVLESDCTRTAKYNDSGDSTTSGTGDLLDNSRPSFSPSKKLKTSDTGMSDDTG